MCMHKLNMRSTSDSVDSAVMTQLSEFERYGPFWSFFTASCIKRANYTQREG